MATNEDCSIIDIQEGNRLSSSVTEVGECSRRGVKRKRSEYPPWKDLPPDIVYNIFSRLETTDLIFGAPYSCQSWYDVSLDASLWKEVEMPMEIGMRNMMLGPNEEIEAAEEQAMGMEVEVEEKDIAPMEGTVNERA
ncbi:uncharacterized protein [Aristolochia californica]|uniref:uncharacterized protein n=1 Tax=Aristolochia californica TaxID=171875 RepID=UPI0035DE993A